jgi:hypothetical protein
MLLWEFTLEKYVNSQSNIQIAVEVDVTVGNEQKLVWEQGKKRQKRLRNCPK